MSSDPVFHVAGFDTCPYYQKAKAALTGVSILFPNVVKLGDGQHFSTKEEYQTWLATFVNEGFSTPLTHTSSPLVWTETTSGTSATTPTRIYIGGCDATLLWCQRQLSSNTVSARSPALAADLALDVEPLFGNDATHGYEYDLVVIGGGSGGLAAAKEAAKLGAKVACLDYVKPSPAGSKWGLGGTCVNVGCIPKKLMHTAALLGEAAKEAVAFGWHEKVDMEHFHANTMVEVLSKDGHGWMSATLVAPKVGSDEEGYEVQYTTSGAVEQGVVRERLRCKGQGSHNWITLRQHVQNHIKGLNFAYKVELREKEVKYINALGQFLDPHTLKCTEQKIIKKEVKEIVTTITSRRFIVAVGGRPTPLDIPGGELAISSDDLFMKKDAPGKTCVVGAGYVALECAGFLTGLHQGEVTVLVRSMLLRGFDRDMVDKIQTHMLALGTKILIGRLPIRIEKVPQGDDTKLRVVYDNGQEELFDTVIAAVGRYADTQGLGLAAAGVVVDSKSGKIPCLNERTNVPHIYAIGDVVMDAPELTPVAIQAGKLLCRRLFRGIPSSLPSPYPYHGSGALMIYSQIPTTVFTPLELGTVGLTEEQAIAQYGSDDVDCFASIFHPLEWTLWEDRPKGVNCMAKVVVQKSSGNRVLGMHIASPNAGEIIQGFAVAYKKGLNLTHEDLLDYIGIHPTIAEELVSLTVSKSSGESIEKGSC